LTGFGGRWIRATMTSNGVAPPKGTLPVAI
jgi:hypothetical protein